MDWIFDGIGTELISLLIGLVTGGTVGYKIGVKNRILEKQNGRDNSEQIQIGSIINNGNSKSR